MNLFDTINQFKRIKRTGLVDTIKGVREPQAGTPAVSAADLKTRLLGVKDVRVPLEIVEGEGGKKGDLVGRWRIRDATWWNAFKKADTSYVTELHMTLDEATHEVRVLNDTLTVRWNSNIPKVGGFSTKPAKVHAANTNPIVEGKDPLNTNNDRWYVLDTNELKELVGEMINRSGWTYKTVHRKKTLAEG
jgi:hypothetical protein